MQFGKSVCVKTEKSCIGQFDEDDNIFGSLVNKKALGVYDYLSEKEASWQNHIHKSESDENLFVMPAGNLPSNPSDLLNENKLQTLMTFLKSGFDTVIINCPSSIEESSIALIGKYAEKTLFILDTDSNASKTNELISNFVNENKFKGISIVLNRKDL